MCNSEQAYHYEKAVLFGDYTTARQILGSRDPKRQKYLGRKVKNFNTDVWASHCEQVMEQILLCKFSQNYHLRLHLLSTGNRTLIEASPWDAIFGVKLATHHPHIFDPAYWKGQNKLGKILESVREKLKQ